MLEWSDALAPGYAIMDTLLAVFIDQTDVKPEGSA